MRRTSEEQKSKNADVHDDSDEVSDSMEADSADMDEVESGASENGVETSSSSAKKRHARGQAKVDEEDYDETGKMEKQENGKSPAKRRKKDDSDGLESEPKAEKSVSKKKKENGQKAKGNKKLPVAKGGKKEKAGKKRAEVPEVDEVSKEEEYEVEKVIAVRTIKGMRQFLVRWKGYTQEDDTWEQEKELNCEELIEEFLAEQGNEKTADKVAKGKNKQEPKKKGKKKAPVKKSSEGKSVAPAVAEDDNDADSSKEYEVGKIIDVHFGKDKKREFLIRWQGFSSKDDTWEPEDQLNCPELIGEFMKNLEKLKDLDTRELRANRVHTKRYTLTMYGDKRQSRRNVNKERKTYYECD
ncbi:uncharacterized protein DDB_G0283697-like [Copidosoma floridanum]|uniref:uncharacterized protein DDB_G0283697-like n=1 Tax=Copidosoma floridanum TaxID=29053 RepID=UPI0006C9AD03|nr:uncharacterized protein DDB_G0283697-like [Copidosoma floridanum]